MHNSSRRLAPVLWTLLGLFIARVLGQWLVSQDWAPWLPPMDAWYSGLLAYPYLLTAQLLIIMLLTKVSWDFTRTHGFFVTPRQLFGRGVLYFGYLYLAAMILRYIIHMSLYPEDRWLGGTIPIVFHWVLATYVILFGRYHRTQLGTT